MQWAEVIREATETIKPVTNVSLPLLQRMLSLVDLTSLNANDTESGIAAFCEKAQLSFGHVAAVCVYPAFVRLVAAQFAGTAIKAATVANFPEGSSSLESVLLEIGAALQEGAQEIDVVFPYERYLAGEQQYARTFVAACKAACGDDVILKVILETGALLDPAIIADAALDALTAGADFIKTSTGKIAEGATLEAAATMLLVIKHATPQLKHNVGIKISGGVREIQQAAQYMQLADNIMGKDWVEPATFRIGASKLVDEIMKGMMR
jgi:deoxyribose-phosphate aldolase